MSIHGSILFALFLALLCAGCSWPWQGIDTVFASPKPQTADEPATPANTVVIVIPESPSTLNPYLSMAPIVRQVADAIAAPLATVDANGLFVPVLAAELPALDNGGVSADYRRITWKLRPNLKWSDGHPLTSADIRFTWEAVSHPDSGAVNLMGFELIEAIDTPDPLTAVVYYREVNPAYLEQFMLGLLPRHAAGPPQEMLNWAWNRNPVGAGPFLVREWIEGESITLARNPHYYLPGQPYLDQLIFKVTPDPAQQLAMMAQDEAQVHLWPQEPKAVYDQLVGEAAALQERPGQWNMALRFNLSRPDDDDPGPLPPHPILGDLRVRQAIAHAINYPVIFNNVNPGTAPATSPFAYGWYHCDLPRLYRYHPARARALLDEAGWVEGPDGVRIAQGARYAEDGTRLTLRLEGYTDFQPLVDLEAALVEQLAAVGIEVTVQNHDFQVIFGSYSDGAPRKLGNFDLLLYDASLGVEPQAAVFNSFHSSSIPTPENAAGGNYMRWVNAEADAAIEAAGRTVDLAERRAAYCTLAELIAHDLPQLHFYLFTEGYGASNRLSGYQVNIWGSLTWDVQNWKLAAEN
ncbi:MAG TPA: peptide ABC transporter substrate-binding protein [Caldilineaceae bacterium]|nr:peptide ABC transporter substrate-binding protein [Caldilineaceae bacterium]